MPNKFVADGFRTRKLCSRLSSSEMRFYTENGRFAFLNPLRVFGAMYDNCLRLIGKLVVVFLLVLTKRFRKVLRLRRYE